MTCLKCQYGTVKRFGTYGRLRIQRFRCKSCRATFSEPRPKPLGRHCISLERATQIVSLLTEGASVRAIARITEADKNTILSLLLTVGDKCRRVFDKHVRNIRPRFGQADELWSFVHTKERQLSSDDPAEWGDAYTWIALDSETKLVLSYHVGKRNAESAFILARDLSERVTGRFQITTDGFKPYISAIEDCFGLGHSPDCSNTHP